jgi:hypothetical protein
MTHHTINSNLSNVQLSTFLTISHLPHPMTQNKLTIETLFGYLNMLETLQILQITTIALNKW